MDAKASQADRGGEDTVFSETVLIKRAIEVRDKLRDDTYSWILQCLEMIFEYFNEKDPRDVEVERLTDVALQFCLQQLEHQQANDIFEKVCKIKNAKGLDSAKEYDKLMGKEAKLTKKDARTHPKFIRFIDRVKELEMAKELCKTEEISVD